MRKNMPRNRSARALSPRTVPPLKRPNAVRTKLPGIELDDRREVADVALFVGHPIR